MIHHKHPGLVFVDIPKTAGTSIEIMLARLLFGVGHPDEIPRAARVRMHLPVRGIDGQHAKFSEYRLEGPVDRYFAFSIVRHPLARAVSQVAYLRQWDPGRRFFGGKCWKDWLMKLATTRRAMIWGHDLGACQVDYLADQDGRIAMDQIGRFETLGASWDAICQRLGFQAAPRLPHVLKGPGIDLATCFDEESAAALAAKYARDFAAFGYAEQLPGPQRLAEESPGRVPIAGQSDVQPVTADRPDLQGRTQPP